MDSFSFECRGCAKKIKGLEVEKEQLRQLTLALLGSEDISCASGSSRGTVDDKVGGGAMREMRGRAHLSLGGG